MLVEPYVTPILVAVLLVISLFFYARILRVNRQLTGLRRSLEDSAVLHEEKIQQIREELEEGKRHAELWKMRARSLEQSYKARLYNHLLDHLGTRPLRSEDFKLISRFVDQNAEAVGSKANDLWVRIRENQDSAEQKLVQFEEHLRRKLAKIKSDGESEESVSGEIMGKE